MRTTDLGLATSGSQALIIGSGVTGDPEELPHVPAVHRTLDDLGAVLLDGCGLTPDRLTVLEDPADAETFANAVAEAARGASDTLLLYYVGHGLVGVGNELRLCTRATTGQAGSLPYNTLAFGQVLDAIRGHRPNRLIVVLDCCHAGRAADAAFTGFRHHYLLPAAARDQLALAPPGMAHTKFSGELIRLLREGDPAGPEVLTLENVRRLLASRSLGPRVLQDDTTGWFPLARNPAFTGSATSLPPPPPPDSGECPYPGLAAFDESGHRWFHGRERLTDELLGRVGARDRPGLPVVLLGVSGAGKSSLLRAGLLPALRRDRPDIAPQGWTPVLLTPTGRPLRALADALSGPAGISAETLARQLASEPRRVARSLHRRGRATLVAVDQFEETFTLCEDLRERTAFIQALTELAAAGRDPGHPLTVVVSLAAHFYAACAERPELARALVENQFAVPPLGPEEIRAAVTGPAHQEHLRIEDGLVEVILTDLGHSSPLVDATEADRPATAISLVHLAQALAATWHRRVDGLLTVRGYREAGGIAGAITTAADSVFRELGPQDRMLVRQLLLRTVRAGRPLEGVPPTRRAVERTELLRELGGGKAEALLDRLLRAGLLTQSGQAVQLAHEALLRNWPLMRNWLAADPEWHWRHGQLAAAAAAWRASGEDEADLYRGHTLADALDLTGNRSRLEVGEEVLRFLDASVRRQRSADRHSLRRRRLFVAAVVVTVVCLTAATISVWSAVRARRSAADDEAAGRARQLAWSAMTLYAADPPLSGRLAVAAHRSAATDESWAALLSASAGLRRAPGSPRNGSRITMPAAVAFAPDRPLMATVSGSSVRLWDTTTQRSTGALRTFGDIAPAVAFSPDGRRVAVLTSVALLVWDHGTTDGGPDHRVDLPADTGSARGLSFSADGGTIAVAAERTTALVPVARPSGRRLLVGERLRYSAGGRLLSGVDDHGRVRVRRASRTGTPGPALKLPGVRAAYAWAPTVTDDGATLAAMRDDGTVELWTLAGDSPRMTGTLRPGAATATATGPAPAVSGDGRFLAVPTGSGSVEVWDIRVPAAPTPVGRTSGDAGARIIAFSPDGGLLLVADASAAQMWETLPLRQPGAVSHLAAPSPTAVAFSPDGRRVAVGTEDGSVVLRSAAGGTSRGPAALAAASRHRVQDLAFLHDDRTLMVVRGRGAELWNLLDRGATRPMAVVPGVRADRARNTPRLLVRAADNSAELWDVTDPAHPDRTAVLETSDAVAGPVALSPDGRTAFTGKWWSLASPDAPRNITPPTTVGNALPAGATMTMAEGGGLAVDRSAVASPYTPPGAPRMASVGAPGAAVTAAALVSDGSLLATGDSRGTVRLWRRMRTGEWKNISELPRRDGRVTAIALTTAGDLAVSADDGQVVVSHISPPALAERLCEEPLPAAARKRWHDYAGDGTPESVCGGDR